MSPEIDWCNSFQLKSSFCAWPFLFLSIICACDLLTSVLQIEMHYVNLGHSTKETKTHCLEDEKKPRAFFIGGAKFATPALDRFQSGKGKKR